MSQNKQNSKTRRLTEDKEYKRPSKTITDTLQTNEEIRRKLDGYARVTDLESIPLGTHLRYITWKNGKERFTLGGKLRKVDPRYVILYNNNFSWSVQRKHFDGKKLVFETVFFNKMTDLDKCQIALIRQQEELDKMKKENTKLKRKLCTYECSKKYP